MLQTEGIIFLSEKRKCFENDTFRSYIILPNPESVSPFTSLIKFADNTLSAQKTSILLVEEDYIVLLLPLVGAIEISYEKESKIVNSGEIAFFFVKNQDKILIQNPYENELVNYLEIWIKREDIIERGVFITQFNLEIAPNKLTEIFSANKISEKLFIGKFNGRKEDILPIENYAFVFVINGVFEVQNRLLENRDGLILWNLDELEFEGLGQENIILVISL